MILILLMLIIFGSHSAIAGTLSPVEIMQRVDMRETGDDADLDVQITLINRSSEKRMRTGKILKKNIKTKDRQVTKQITIFLTPAEIRNVAMLSFDYKDENITDEMWLYLSALRKLRRIPASERGDNFVGTDFSYEDVKQGWAVNDYDYKLLGITTWNDESGKYEAFLIEATPKTADLKEALKFERTSLTVLNNIFMIVEQKFFDKNNKLIRINTINEIKQIQNIWTPIRLESFNFQTQHKSLLEFISVRYNQGLKEGFFTERTLATGRIR